LGDGRELDVRPAEVDADRVAHGSASRVALGHGPAAVHRQRLPGDEPRLVGEEEDDGRVEVARLRGAAAVERLLAVDEGLDLRVGHGAAGGPRVTEGAARRPSSGCLPWMKAWICGSAMARRLPGVSVRPGSSALKRMPRGAEYAAAATVRPSRPALAAA